MKRCSLICPQEIHCADSFLWEPSSLCIDDSFLEVPDKAGRKSFASSSPRKKASFITRASPPSQPHSIIESPKGPTARLSHTRDEDFHPWILWNGSTHSSVTRIPCEFALLIKCLNVAYTESFFRIVLMCCSLCSVPSTFSSKPAGVI